MTPTQVRELIEFAKDHPEIFGKGYMGDQFRQSFEHLRDLPVAQRDKHPTWRFFLRKVHHDRHVMIKEVMNKLEE